LSSTTAGRCAISATSVRAGCCGVIFLGRHHRVEAGAKSFRTAAGISRRGSRRMGRWARLGQSARSLAAKRPNHNTPERIPDHQLPRIARQIRRHCPRSAVRLPLALPMPAFSSRSDPAPTPAAGGGDHGHDDYLAGIAGRHGSCVRRPMSPSYSPSVPVRLGRAGERGKARPGAIPNRQ
jgi:hypothetical protein